LGLEENKSILSVLNPNPEPLPKPLPLLEILISLNPLSLLLGPDIDE
jgi:hypothetical protein